jgi:ABC-type Zn uptake system ZnuABC Zn-binding protein ZnuA
MELPARIAVTLPLFEEFARDAGLDNVEVISLIPLGADPHTYQFTQADIDKMRGIDFFFLNGLGLDSHLEEAIEANRDEGSYVIPFAPNIRSPQGGGLTAAQADDNAHLWLDPDLAYIYTEIVADELIIYDGINKGFYDANFAASRARILALQDEVQGIIDQLPPERRNLVTLHDSFAHFARRFGLTQAGYAAPLPSSPVSDAEIARLAQPVRDQGIPAVFNEFGYDPTTMQRVAAAAGAEVCTLYSDVIGGDVVTYADMMRANAREIVRCLS